MSKKKISPDDITHLTQYQKYALNLNYPAAKMQWKYSAVNKHPIQDLIASNNLDIYNTVTVLYKINNFELNSSNETVIYNIAFLSTLKNNLLYINQICPAGSIASKNGEYRSGLINYDAFTQYLLNNKNLNKFFQTIVDYLTQVSYERKNNLAIEFFYPSGKKYINKIEIETECKKNILYFYSIAWIKFYYEHGSHTTSNNLNITFKEIMLTYNLEDKKAFIQIFKEFKSECEILIYICNNSIDKTINLYENKKLGQKMTILNLAEYENSFNIEHSAWIELSINNKISDIVLSKITNGFALLDNYIFIRADKIIDLFDNNEHYTKIIKSEKAIKIIELLTQAQAYNTNTKKLNTMIDDIIKKTNNSFSVVTKEIDEIDILQNNIMQSIDYAKENIILSNTILNMISEYTGQTFYDITLSSDMFSVKNYPNFTKYMFQLIYNLYCLNTKAHCIHGDLHLNNITISPMFNKPIKIDIDDPQIVYIINENTYHFANNFHNLCIIDFNASIINPDLYVENLSNIKNNFNKDKLLQIQIKKILSYLYSIKPIYRQYESVIENNMTFHFNEYFKILTALDIYNVSYKLLAFTKNKKLKVHGDSIDLITSIHKCADYYLTAVFERLLNTKDYTEFKKMEYPAICIIKKIFTTESLNKANVTDIFSYTN